MAVSHGGAGQDLRAALPPLWFNPAMDPPSSRTTLYKTTEIFIHPTVLSIPPSVLLAESPQPAVWRDRDPPRPRRAQPSPSSSQWHGKG